MTSSWVCRFAEYFREHKAQLPIHVWRDASPQHFNTPTGDFKCDNCPDAPYPFVCEVRPVPSYCTRKRCLWLLGCSQQPPQPCRAAGLVCCSLQAGGQPTAYTAVYGACIQVCTRTMHALPEHAPRCCSPVPTSFKITPSSADSPPRSPASLPNRSSCYACSASS